MTPPSRPSSENVVVGPCASGKPTSVRGSRSHGFDARACAQEHSAVRTLWRHQGRPTLILLTAGQESTRLRRHAAWRKVVHTAHIARLAVAKANADLIIVTDDLSSGGVLRTAVAFLAGSGTLDQVNWGGSTSPGDQ